MSQRHTFWVLKVLAQGPLLASAPIYSLIAIGSYCVGMTMANLDFGTTPVVELNDSKIFGTADTAVYFEKLFADDMSLQRALSALQRGPVRFYRDNVVVFEEDLEDYLLFVVSGVVAVARPAKTALAMSLPFTFPATCLVGQT
jgi:hypothetical protein